MEDQRRLVASLCLPALETHISYVLFDRGTVYKIKKAVRFPFLDFSTLGAREFYCREELRLNRRLAPSIYLDVVPVTGTVDTPVIGGSGPPIEYAVKMREFDQSSLLSEIIRRDELTTDRIDALAGTVAGFHQRTGMATAHMPYGDPAGILEDARANFAGTTGVDDLRAWTEREGARCTAAFIARKAGGFVRECHGDLHLGNVALVDGAATLFDCIEFNPAMRWIDVMSDVAFLVMDLRHRNRPDLAARFLNGYLERTGDYDGLGVLRFYIVYRAMVRAKIARLRKAHAEYQEYVDLVRRDIAAPRPSVVITHGVSGSGKSTRAQAFVDMGAVAIRSDVERRRLRGLPAHARTRSETGGGLYTAEITGETYRRLAALARTVVSAGYTVVVDAAFLKRAQRDELRAVAESLRVPLVIADCAAPLPALAERIERRLEHGRDASEATIEVLAYQLATEEPLGPDELALTA